MAFVNPQGMVFARWHGAGIVFRRHTFVWVLPALMGPHLTYDPRRLPVPVTRAHFAPNSVEVWEETRSDADRYYRRIFAVGKDNEAYYLRSAIARIDNGYRGGTTLPPRAEIV